MIIGNQELHLTMSSKPLSPIRKAWYKWKSLHLPWRKRFLVGLDLQGNTFWEFRDTLNSHKNRMRRIVQYPPSTPYSDVNISPQWHQWLRHTRRDPPSIAEQSQDLIRQENLKVLAAQADARWAAKPSFLDKPRETGQPAPALEGLILESDPKEQVAQESPEVEDVGWDGEVRAQVPGKAGEGLKEAEEPEDLAKGEAPKMQVPDHKRHPFNVRPDDTRVKDKKYKEDPWKQARGAPSEEWQPEAWTPNVAATKR